MSPRYDSNLTEVTSALVVLKPGEYEFLVGDPKAFSRKKEGGAEVVGISFLLTVAEIVSDGDPNARGKKVYRELYLHSEKAKPFTKQFVMASYGYENREEHEIVFNEKTRGLDWGYNTDTGEVGDVYKGMRGTRVICGVGQQPNEKNPNEMQQTWDSVRPLNATNGK